MNILHVTPSIGRKSFGHGAVVLGLTKCQLTSGLNADIWVCEEQSEIDAVCLEAGVEPGRVQTFTRVGPAALCYVPSMEKMAAGGPGSRYQVLHQHGIWTALSRVNNRWRRAYERPSVVAPHGALDHWARQKSKLKKEIVLFVYERQNLSSAACLHATARSEMITLREYGLRNPVAVIPNGISDAWLASTGDAEAFRQRCRIPPHARILLYLGRITPKKGLPLLIDAISTDRRSFAPWCLVVAGVDESHHEADLMSLVQERNLQNVVHFVGPLFGRDKRDAFAAAELFVLPSLSEGAPIAILEALGAEVPVLTTHASPWRQLVTERCGWWVPASSDGIASALAEALPKAPDDLSAMGQRGLGLVRSQYTWRAAAAMTLDLYGWLLGRRAQPAFVDTE